MKVPNPFSVGVEVARPVEIGLKDIPETRYGKTSLAEGLGEKFQSAVDAWQKKVDKTKSDDNANELQRFLIDQKTNKDTGWGNLNGKNALERPNGVSLEEETSMAFKQKYEELRAKCGSLAQKEALDRTYQLMDVKRQQDIASHVVKQQSVYDMDVANDKLEMGAELASDYKNTENFESGLAVLRDTARYLSDRAGVNYDPSLGPGIAHANNIDQMIDSGDVKSARDYYDKFKDEMNLKQKNTVEKALLVAERKDQELDLAIEILQGTDSLGSALKATTSIPSGLRDGVRKHVRQHYSDLKVLETEHKREVTDTAWKIYEETGDMPPSLEAEMARVNPSGYRSLKKRMDIDAGGGVKVSDPRAIRELEHVFSESPEDVQDLDLRNYSSQLSPKDMTAYTKRQREIGKTEKEDFISLTKQYGKAEKLNSAKTGQLALSAARKWDEYVEAHNGELPTKDQQDSMARALFTGEKKGTFWDSDLPEWEAIYENPDVAISDLGSVGFSQSVERKHLEAYATQRLGLSEYPRDKKQQQVLKSLYLGNGYPPDVWREATKKTIEMAKSRPGAKADRRAISIVAREMVFNGLK